MTRLGTATDPGPNPDETTQWVRFGKKYVINKYDKKHAAYDEAQGLVRPRADINVSREIYQENEKYVWVWEPVRETLSNEQFDAEVSATLQEKAADRKYTDDELKWVRQVVPEFKVLDLPSSGKVFRFRESSAGLPTQGSWRNSLGVGDMNEDGNVDLVVPPPRGSVGSAPLIYLGDGTGNWKLWDKASFPTTLNYGSASVADLNGDGHLDVVFGVHLFTVKAVLGDGKGYFVDASKGLPSDFATRRTIVADFNKDGSPDIAALSEGPKREDSRDPGVAGQEGEKPRLRVFLNDGKANWREIEAAEVGRQMAGDWMAATNLDGDGYLDIFTASNFFNSPDTIYLNSKGKWKNVSRGWMPFYSYYGALTAGRFAGTKSDDVIVSYVRIYPTAIPDSVVKHPEITQVVGLERVSMGKNGLTRTPIERWEGHRAVWAMGSADLDGDGNLDLTYVKSEPREFVFLTNDGKGGFTRAKVEGFAAMPNVTYDVKFADVNKDGRPDLIVMYEAQPDSPGAVRVFLNETPQAASKSKKK